MTWPTIPNFTVTTTPDADDLNTLADACDHLWDAYPLVVPPFSCIRDGGVPHDVSSSTTLWVFRHRYRYLHYKTEMISGTASNVDIFYNGTKVVNGDDVASGVVDLNSLGLTVGAEYDVYVDADWSGVLQVTYLFEHPSSSAIV